MKNIFVLWLFLYLNISVFSQTSNNPSMPFIEVTGTAKREIEPNQIHVSITLSEKSIDNKKFTLEQQEAILQNILSEMKIPNSKLVLIDLNSSIITQKYKEIGFKQEKQFSLILEKAEQVSELFKKLFDKNIKEADVIKIDNTDIIAINKEVRIEALKAAKIKAEYLLNAIGNKIGFPLEIIELNSYNNTSNLNLNSNSVSSNGYIPLENNKFKKIIVSFSYKVKYSIE